MSMVAGQRSNMRPLAILFLLAAGIFFSAVFAESSPIRKTIRQSVPFTTQAPLGEWSDDRQQDGCEEASVLMAMSWANQIPAYPPKIWKSKLLAISDYEKEKYGEYRDASLEDILSRLFEDYFDYDRAKIKTISSSKDIVAELEAGRLVIIPANGQALRNPNFKAPGPERHMVLITGYDYEKDEFITNDPGTRKGENYRYKSDIIFEAIRPYKTGYHEAF